MAAPLRLVIFDVDGTLIDSQNTIVAAMADAFARMGEPAPERTAVLDIIGLSLPQAMARLAPGLPGAARAELVDAYKAAFGALSRREGNTELPFYPGALEALERLDGQGTLLGIATGKARRGLDRVLDSHDLRRFFTVLQTADDAFSKPHPQMVENCLTLSGVAPSDAVLVGDTEYDMQMATTAGVPAIGVSWGYHAEDRLVRGGAAEVIRDFPALDEALARAWGPR